MRIQNFTDFLRAAFTFFTCLATTIGFLFFGGLLLFPILPVLGFVMMFMTVFMGGWLDGLKGPTGFIDFSEVWFIPVGVWLTTGVLFGIATRQWSTRTQVRSSVITIVGVTIGMNVAIPLLGFKVSIQVL
ncbi:hypothetical protein [Limnoglobus roseus]|nr:hypothetical protein [Limnoglobus roseus]